MVRLALLQCDLSRFPLLGLEAMKWQNLDADDIIYIVTARGHDHQIKAAHILGRFVSHVMRNELSSSKGVGTRLPLT